MKELIKQTKAPKSQAAIVDKIKENCLEFVQNSHANFVVQEVLSNFSQKMCESVITQMLGKYVQLSLNKFSSKPIEACIQRASEAVQDQIIDEFCASHQLEKVVQSLFGNYVLQNSLKNYLVRDETKLKLIESIIKRLDKVTVIDIQFKWGTDILKPNLETILKTQFGAAEPLRVEKVIDLLERKMDVIESSIK